MCKTNFKNLNLSVSITFHSQPGEEKIEPKPRMNHELLETYRKTWSSDAVYPDDVRKTRFTSETRSALMQATKQKPNIEVVRPLPGSPKALEIYREQLVQKYGIFAFAIVRYHLGREEIISVDELKIAINKINVQIRPHELGQVYNSK